PSSAGPVVAEVLGGACRRESLRSVEVWKVQDAGAESSGVGALVWPRSDDAAAQLAVMARNSASATRIGRGKIGLGRIRPEYFRIIGAPAPPPTKFLEIAARHFRVAHRT